MSAPVPTTTTLPGAIRTLLVYGHGQVAVTKAGADWVIVIGFAFLSSFFVVLLLANLVSGLGRQRR